MSKGSSAVRELLAVGRRKVYEVVVSDEARSSEIDEIVALARAKAVPVREVPRALFGSLTSSAVPQGITARAERIVPVGLDELLAGKAAFLVVLDEVTDPHNLGAILRSALGAGATGVVISRRRSAPFTATALKSAAGAAEHLPISVVASIAQAVGELSRRGVWTVGLDPQAEESIWDLEIADRPIALVAGAEGRGLAPLARSRCDLLCRIPLYGPVESLNVSVAVAVAAFSVAARRGELERNADPPVK